MIDEFRELKRIAKNVLHSDKVNWIFLVGRDDTQMFPVCMCECSSCADVLQVNEKALMYYTEWYQPLCSRCVSASQHKRGIVQPLMGWVNRRVLIGEIDSNEAVTVCMTHP